MDDLRIKDADSIVDGVWEIAGELQLIRKLFERFMEIKEYEYKRDREIDERSVDDWWNKIEANMKKVDEARLSRGNGWRRKTGEHITHE
jgi:hypothetical protein